jgi:hypothetical protein
VHPIISCLSMRWDGAVRKTRGEAVRTRQARVVEVVSCDESMGALSAAVRLTHIYTHTHATIFTATTPICAIIRELVRVHTHAWGGFLNSHTHISSLICTSIEVTSPASFSEPILIFVLLSGWWCHCARSMKRLS